MRIARVTVENFRCLKNFSTSLDDVTVLVGANGTGKSTLLRALRWFFEGGGLAPVDHAGHQVDYPVSVGVTFSGFNDADREVLGPYLHGDKATFWRTYSVPDGDKFTVLGRAYPPFAEARKHEKAMPKREAYQQLCGRQPNLGLPKATTAAAVDDAMAAWESEHPDQLEDVQLSATHLFGVTDGSHLNGRFDFVLVPAVSDPEVETRDARGTLLRQLLDRALGEQSQMRARLDALERQVSGDMYQIMVAEGGQALEDLASGITEELGHLVSGGQVLLEARPPTFRVPQLSVDVRVADGDLCTDVGHQGQGFQRALLIAVVQCLAALHPTPPQADAGGLTPKPPALFLAVEEPELYQHPLQARHFAATLAALGERSESTVQVAYATHSEHFVDPTHYRRLRRFQRIPGTNWPQTQVTEATVERVAARLQGAYDAEQVALRVRMTLRRQVAEAVFAKAVIVVEGTSDAGLLHGIADRCGGFDALGVAVVAGSGKRQLLIPWAILTELQIPVYVVFDADGGLARRRMAQGWPRAKAEHAEAKEQCENKVVLAALRAPIELAPVTQVTSTYAVFADTLETECAAWEGFDTAVEAAKDELGDWREKSDDAYRQAATTLESDPPVVLWKIVERMRALVA
ncbi:MAG: AAA family ATPase [Pseudonocardiaceae bacterium]